MRIERRGSRKPRPPLSRTTIRSALSTIPRQACCEMGRDCLTPCLLPDWPDVSGPRAKIDEELAELDAESDADRQSEELGDLLFAVANLARHLKIDPEEALREANRKFERRFRAIEKEVGFDSLTLDEKEALWVRAKADQADSSA